jgi:EAL domain-containing protein (putative c-di-GMP-specific phosphodiesterase class I)
MIHLQGVQAVAFRVLVIDADAIERAILLRCVEMLGWTGEAASTTEEALTLFSARPHSILLIDLRLGYAECVTLLRQIRRLHADPALILLPDDDDRTRTAALWAAHELGLRVAGTLRKPIDPYRLHALLLSNPVRPKGARGKRGATFESRLALGFPGAADLDQALRGNEIHTQYQPKTDLATGEIVGVEALARWQSPIFGAVPPDLFIPVAEQSDLIARLTFRVLEDAIRACRQWREVSADCTVAVNISAFVLGDPRLLTTITSLLSDHNVPAGALIVEVAESSILCGQPNAAEALNHIKAMGIRVSMDGFGTGHSSVLSLLRMPYAELKIDRSFVAASGTDPDAWKLIRSTVSLARELGMSVVAEGIETEDISDRLRDAGCDTGQGWFFGRPMQEDAISQWLRREQSVTVADRVSNREAEAPLQLQSWR